MTNKETVTKAFVGATDYSDGGEFRQTTANPEVPTAPNDLLYRVERGVLDTKKAGYRVEAKQGHDGDLVYSDIMGSVPAAFNKALEALGYVKGAVTAEVGLRALFPAPKGDNKPPEEVLSEDDLASADTMIDTLDKALAELDQAEEKTRDAHLHTANAVRDIRLEFASKRRWGALKADRLKAAPEPVKALLYDNANAVGYLVKFARAADLSDFWEAMPLHVKTPRTFEKEVGLLRRAIADHIVTSIFEETKVTVDKKKVWAFGTKLSKMPLDEAFVTLLKEASSEGVNGVKDGFADAVKTLAAVHLDNVSGATVDLFTTETKDSVVKHIATSGDGAATTLFGIEGPDEMVAAVCGVLNGYEQSKTIEEASSEDSADGVKALAKTIQQGNKFSAMDVETAARHLMHIMAGKLDDAEREASADDAQAVLGTMQTLLDGFRDGSLDKADTYTAVAVEGGDVSDADDAEDAADAA